MALRGGEIVRNSVSVDCKSSTVSRTVAPDEPNSSNESNSNCSTWYDDGNSDSDAMLSASGGRSRNDGRASSNVEQRDHDAGIPIAVILEDW